MNSLRAAATPTSSRLAAAFDAPEEGDGVLVVGPGVFVSVISYPL
jgi:hypothetical protein